MDAESSFKVLLFIAAFTTFLIGVIRTIGTIAARTHPDNGVPAPGAAAPRTSGDPLRMIAVLTAAAMEILESEDVYLTSIVELPEPGGPKHWPRVGKMHFFQKSQYRH